MRVDIAATQVGRSAAGSRCSVPRAAQVFTSRRLSHSSLSTLAAVAPPFTRRSSAVTAEAASWACTPLSRRATATASVPRVAPRNCRSMRHRSICSHVNGM
ncbi:hypothetical protein Phou_097440 [Phytohabitans houttuyneae]|uniref:Uncharacterized protein n=1 Tax=Phytohabitans houttuyneae TaxID=1076126 RepID=A0A6V8KNY5_9ACTN|nr:hypothetical protein [Phytohabitans houttuyneae]GFJ85564.1 hypothetical protein Phou_097440 [Phytohabitans houttuyneae]